MKPRPPGGCHQSAESDNDVDDAGDGDVDDAGDGDLLCSLQEEFGHRAPITTSSKHLRYDLIRMQLKIDQ